MTTAERFYSELDALKLKTREVPHTLTAEEVRACEAVKLQMKGELSTVGKVIVEEVEKIDETVKAASAIDDVGLGKVGSRFGEMPPEEAWSMYSKDGTFVNCCHRHAEPRYCNCGGNYGREDPSENSS